MKSLPEPISFQWDKGNRDKNWKKHAVTNSEAEEVFINMPILIFDDPGHSKSEVRHLAWGKTNNRRFLAIAFTIRDGHIRIISARNMNKKERKHYEQET